MSNSELNTTETEPQITVNDLQTGDIFCFEGVFDSLEDIVLDGLIMYLSNSQASHAGLFFKKDMANQYFTTAESHGSHGLAEYQFSPKPNSRKIWVRRLNNGADLTPVLERAQHYVDMKMPYPFAALALLGGLLVYKKVSTPGVKQDVVIKVLKLITTQMKTWLEKNKYDGQHRMTCSEFVATCYRDAAQTHPELELTYSGAVLQTKQELVTYDSAFNHLLHLHYTQQVRLSMDLPEAAAIQNELSTESALSEALKELKTDIETAMEKGAHEINGFVTEHTKELHQTLFDFLHIKHKVQTPVKDWITDVRKLLENEKYQEPFFIAPGDLKDHVTNVTKVGVLHIDEVDMPVNA
jgi:hypothetical protein